MFTCQEKLCVDCCISHVLVYAVAQHVHLHYCSRASRARALA